jgi:hypothetical protein
LNKSWYSHYQRVSLCLSYGGTGAPSGGDYTKVYSNYGAFAALKTDGSITEGAPMPPPFEPPHAVIDPSALRAAKAYLFE